MTETGGVPAVPTSVTSIPRGPLTPRAVFVGAICVMAAAVLIAARQPFQQTRCREHQHAAEGHAAAGRNRAAETERAAGRSHPVGSKRVNGTRGSAGPT